MKALYLLAAFAITLSGTSQTTKKAEPADVNIGVPTEQSNIKEIPESKDANAIYNTAALQVQPEYPGGITALLAYIDSKLKKPEMESTSSLRVFVSFVIEKDGSLSNIKTVRDPGYGLGKEVERVLKNSKIKWNHPGIINGKQVRTSFSLPVTIDFK